MTRQDPQASALPAAARRVARMAGMAGAGAMVACVAIWIAALAMHRHWPDAAAEFYKGYLIAWLFFLGISLGAMAAVMVHHLVGGEWGYYVRRFGEAAANVLPLLFVLFVPVLVGMSRIYPWANATNHNAFVALKRGYLNPGMFIVRYIIYFAVWIAIAWSLRTLSLRHDRTPGPRTKRLLRNISAAGLVAYFVTMSLAAVDWIMSLEPHWYSTVFGLMVCIGQAVTGTAMLIIVLELMSREPPFAARVQPRHFNDLATLLITAVILWAYHAFSQLLVTWMGNIQGEISWYVKRSQGPWRAMAGVLMIGGFLAPFVLLLQRGIKKRGKAMVWVCSGLLVMQLLDVYWMIAPSGGEPYPGFSGLNLLATVVAVIGIGGLWSAVFIRLLDGPSLMPLGDSVPIALAPPGMPPDMEFPNMGHSPQHNPVSPEAMELGYEPEVVPVRGLLVFIVLVAVTAVILHVLIWWLMKKFEAHVTSTESPLSVVREDQTPPPPRLQPSVGHDSMDYQDLAALRHREDEMFAKLGWKVVSGAKDAGIPEDIVRKVADEQRARAAAAFVPPTTTGKDSNSILPTTIPADDTHPGIDGGPRR